MQEANQLNYEIMIQDTSSNALTEVALGLSMAFFALLILALVSFAIPTKKDNLSHDLQIQTLKPESANHQSASDNNSEAMFVFYFKGQLVNQQMVPVNADTIAKDQAVILALDPSITFQEVIKVQSQLSHVELQLAALTDSWKNSLNEKFKGN